MIPKIPCQEACVAGVKSVKLISCTPDPSPPTPMGESELEDLKILMSMLVVREQEIGREPFSTQMSLKTT